VPFGASLLLVATASPSGSGASASYPSSTPKASGAIPHATFPACECRTSGRNSGIPMGTSQSMPTNSVQGFPAVNDA
jgi:hypothetical protein